MQDKPHYANDSTLGMIYDEVVGGSGGKDGEELLRILLELGLAREERLKIKASESKRAM